VQVPLVEILVNILSLTGPSRPRTA
jgi:hypothetical protein